MVNYFYLVIVVIKEKMATEDLWEVELLSEFLGRKPSLKEVREKNISSVFRANYYYYYYYYFILYFSF